MVLAVVLLLRPAVVAVMVVLGELVVAVDAMPPCDNRHCSDWEELLVGVVMLGQLADIAGGSLLNASAALSGWRVSLCSGSQRAHRPSIGLRPQ